MSRRTAQSGTIALIICIIAGLTAYHAYSMRTYKPLVFDPPIYDVGVHYDRTGRVKFASFLVNQSDYSIQLKSVTVSCGCIVAAMSPSILSPHQRILISGEVNLSSKKSFFQSELGVVNNSASFPLLKIKGYVGDVARVSVPNMRLSEKAQEFGIYINQSATRWKLEHYEAPPGVALSFISEKVISSSSEKRIVLDTFSILAPHLLTLKQDFISEAVFSLGDGTSKLLCRLPLEISELTARPESMTMLFGPVRAPAIASVVVSTSKNIKTLDVSSSEPSISVACVKLDSTHFRIDARCLSYLENTILRGQITAKSDDDAIEIPFQVARLN